MKKMMVLGVLVLTFFLVACVSVEKVSDDDIEASLEWLSDEELLEVVTADADAIAGQAT